MPKKDILVVQGDWNAQIGEDACKNSKWTCGQYCNPETNERGLRFLEFASYNNLKVANTFGLYKSSRRWTWHSPGGDYHNQIYYIMVKRRFQSSMNIAKTRSFPGADIGSDHELVMLTFKLHRQKVKNQGSIRIRFSLEKLTSSKQGRTTTIQDKAGICLTEEQDTRKRWTEYCSELYTHTTTGDPKVLDVPPPINNDSHPVLRYAVEAAVKSLKKGKSAGVDNIPSELVHAGGEAQLDMLLIICNKIWQTGKWPTPWTQPLVITLPKKGNL